MEAASNLLQAFAKQPVTSKRVPLKYFSLSNADKQVWAAFLLRPNHASSVVPASTKKRGICNGIV